jgi:hypothetical protein
VAVVEVERYWFRFRQLGADKNGFLPAKVMEKGEITQDIFVKNVLYAYLFFIILISLF